MNRRIISCLLAVVMFALVFTGCGKVELRGEEEPLDCFIANRSDDIHRFNISEEYGIDFSQEDGPYEVRILGNGEIDDMHVIYIDGNDVQVYDSDGYFELANQHAVPHTEFSVYVHSGDVPSMAMSWFRDTRTELENKNIAFDAENSEYESMESIFGDYYSDDNYVTEDTADDRIREYCSVSFDKNENVLTESEIEKAGTFGYNYYVLRIFDRYDTIETKSGGCRVYGTAKDVSRWLKYNLGEKCSVDELMEYYGAES